MSFLTSPSGICPATYIGSRILGFRVSSSGAFVMLELLFWLRLWLPVSMHTLSDTIVVVVHFKRHNTHEHNWLEAHWICTFVHDGEVLMEA